MKLRSAGASRLRAGRVLDVVVAGAHGGASTSTLAALLPAAWDMGTVQATPEADRCPVQAKGRPIVLAARNTATSARSATAAVGVLRQWGERVTALAIVSDGGPEPRDASARFALLEWQVGGVVRVPYVRELRLVDDPAEVVLPGKAHQALDKLRSLVAADGRGWRK